MIKEINFITEIEQQLKQDNNSFMDFSKAEIYLYEDHFKLLENVFNGDLKAFISTPCDFICVIDTELNEENKKLLEYFKKMDEITDEEFTKYRKKLKEQANKLLKDEGAKYFYWEIDTENFFAINKGRPSKFEIKNGEAVLVKRSIGFSVAGLQFCLKLERPLELTINNLGHRAVFLKSEIENLNKSKIKDNDFYISKLLEQKIEKLLTLVNFIWKQNTQNIHAKTMPSDYMEQSEHFQSLAMQDTNNHTKACALALNAIKCKDIISPNPDEKDVDVYVDSFFKWATKQDFFPEWFFLTDYFKNLDFARYEKATINRYIGEYLPLEEATKYFKHLDFDSIDIAKRGIDMRNFFPLYIYDRGKYKYLKNHLEEKLNKIFIDGIEKKFINKDSIKFSPLQCYPTSNAAEEIILINRLYVSKDKAEYMAKESGLSERLAQSVIESTKLIVNCCPLINEVLKKQDYIEIQNKDSENKINLEVATALLTTYSLLDQKFELISQNNTSSEQKKIKQEEQKKHELILKKLKSDFQTNNSKQEINLAQFIKWMVSNNSDFPILNVKIANNLDLLTIANSHRELISIKNNFIAVMLRFIACAFQTTVELEKISDKLIAPIDKNYLDASNPVDLYINKIKELINSFNAKKLSTIAKEQNTDIQEMFKKINKLGLRWFVQIKGLDFDNMAGQNCGWTLSPKLELLEEKEIEDKLKLMPYYKLKNDSIDWLNIYGEINFEDFLWKELEPIEELYFLTVHFGYYINHSVDHYRKAFLNPKNAKILITLNDVVIPECEVLRFEQSQKTTKADEIKIDVEQEESNSALQILIKKLHPQMPKNKKSKVKAQTLWNYIKANKEQYRNDIEITNVSSWSSSNPHIEWISSCDYSKTVKMYKKAFQNRISELNNPKK